MWTLLTVVIGAIRPAVDVSNCCLCLCQTPERKGRKRPGEDVDSKMKRARSDSESVLDSSEASGNEDLGNEPDSDDNNQVGEASVGCYFYSFSDITEAVPNAPVPCRMAFTA